MANEAVMEVSSLSLYMQSFEEKDLLGADEELDLIFRAHSGDKKARDKLITHNLRLVMSVARGYQNKGLPLLDLIQEGNLGLIHAIDKFDLSKGVRLSTYATWWIRQYIGKALSNQSRIIRIPTNQVENALKVTKAIDDLNLKLERDPTPEEISNVTGIALKHVTQAINNELMNYTYSMNMPVSGADGKESDLGAVIPDERHKSDDDLNDEAVSIILLEVVDTLEPRERHVITERFGLKSGTPRTLDDLSAEMGVSRERVRQIENTALRKLRNPARAAKLRDCYL